VSSNKDKFSKDIYKSQIFIIKKSELISITIILKVCHVIFSFFAERMCRLTSAACVGGKSIQTKVST